MRSDDFIWQAKLAARVHDPAEKALVLLRDPAGHENGTSRALRRLLGLDALASGDIDPDNADALSRVIFKNGLPNEVYRVVQRADWWAAAADRPQWPMEEVSVTTRTGEQKTFKVADWAQVRWTNHPVLVHPLTGERIDLGKHGALGDTEIGDIKKRSFDHFSRLLVSVGAREESTHDLRKTLLVYWRFGPDLLEENDNGKIGSLWKLLPADTRVPDHSIWEHLDLVSAFAGAFAADPEGDAALLALSIGPVQSFIASSRSTSDLWAGSHLLARLAWEAMRPVCEELGPDAILFPRLRGVPQVDLWMREQGLPAKLFETCTWANDKTDGNPLFTAALPNRFVALVPASRAKAIAELVERSVRQWLQEKGKEIVDRLLAAAGLPEEGEQHCHVQMREQLAGFPEVHWAAVPFSLIRPPNADKQTDLDTTQLSAAMAPFFGAIGESPSGFLDSAAWKVLQRQARFADDATGRSVFFAPNPGVLYPAIHELSERVMAAAKSLRTFEQSRQQGWRCSLTGESEWLTTDPRQLEVSYRQQTDTLWARIARRRPAWAKTGEHLGALPAIKRLWPTLFSDEVGRALGKDIPRFVVSTHTMAMAHQLDKWVEHGGHSAPGLKAQLAEANTVALPRRLMRRHAANPGALADAKRLPAVMDSADDTGDEKQAFEVRRLVRQTLALGTGQADEGKVEAYYGLLLLDGDHMGRILSGDDRYAVRYKDSFHPQVLSGFETHAIGNPAIRAYGEQRRAMSPNRHLAISGALNDFSLTVVRHIVEEENLGRLIYAGGDDVLAMLPVVDLLPAMQRLRQAYSGHDPDHEGGRHPDGLTLSKGFALLDGRLMRMMGTGATASCGAVIAHHQAPLSAVRRELQAAEQRAKTAGGRDAFSLTLLKRSGGALRLTAKWGEPVALLGAFCRYLSHAAVSRRAVYNSLEWLVDLPEPEGDGAMLAGLLAYQLQRQAGSAAKEHDTSQLAERLTRLALQQPARRLHWLENFLCVAEFLARETRIGAEQ